MSSAERDSGAADDQRAAQREREARELLLAAGADRLEQRPWQPKPVPPSAVDLIQFFLWQSSTAAFGSAEDGDRRRTKDNDRDRAKDGHRAGAGAQGRGNAEAALRLLRAARAEVDQLETGLLFAARGLGLTWAQMATALGLNSPQACQQRLDRLLARGEHPRLGGADR